MAKSASASTWSGRGRGNSADHHVGVAADFDLLQSVLVHQRVEGAVQLVEEPHQIGRRGAAGAFGEADDVGEQNRGFVVFVGDEAAVGCSLSRSAMLAGNMLASRASERSYWASMTASARAVSRRANHTVTTIITQEEMVVMTKPIDWAQAGLESGVAGDQELQRDDPPGGDRRQSRRQHDVLDAQQQHHQTGAHQEEEFTARTGADVPGAGEDRNIGRADERQRRNQISEAVQSRDKREDRRRAEVDRADLPRPGIGHNLHQHETRAHHHRQPGGDGEHAVPSRDGFGVVLAAVAGLFAHGRDAVWAAYRAVRCC